MNKAYKVVFNKLRGTMMVVNEATSSIQKKSTKTVVATAVVAMLAGVAGTAIANTVYQDGMLSWDGTELLGRTSENLAGEDVNGTITINASGVNGTTYGAFTNLYHPSEAPTANAVAVGDVKLSGGEFKSNSSTNAGGGATLWQDGRQGQNALNHTITGTKFTENSAAYNGGALALMSNMTFDVPGTTTLNNVTFTGNKQTGTKLLEQNGKYYLNPYIGGGAVFVEGTELIDNGSTYTDNSASKYGYGGAISLFNATADVTGATFNGNSAYTAGAISVYGSSQLTVDNSVFSGNTSKGWGGAINSAGGGIVIATNTTFSDNVSGGVGGAIGAESNSTSLTLSNVRFENNHSIYDGGAIGTYKAFKLDGGYFEGNTAQLDKDASGNYTVAVEDDIPVGGGAISFGAVSEALVGTVVNTTFKGNVSGKQGGAIGTRLGSDANNSAAKLDISASFIENHAYTNGGAIYNTFYTNNGLGKGDGVTVTGVFTKNIADKNGGAIFNDGAPDNWSSPTGKGGVMTISDSTFTGNTAGENGGAIYNTGTLTLQGKNHFEGNTANGILNDIYNAGTLNISGDLTLNGGIVNAGTVNFTGETTITTILTGDAIQNGSYALIKGGTIEGLDDDNAKLAENAIYNIAWSEEAGKQGWITVELKSANELVDSLPVTSQQAGTVAAILPTLTGTANVPAPVAAIADAISIAAQTGNGDAVAQIAEDLAPSTAPVVSSVSQGVNNAIAGVANARMAANRAAGDVFTGGSAWAQMIYNSADQDATKKTAKLESDTYGITVGIDGKIGDNLTIGAGFGVTKTDAESGTRDIDVDSYALFGYTEYNADNGWFVNGMVNAIRGRYEENKAPAGIKLTAKYQTTVLGAGVATGYHFENGISPEVGLRYLRTHQGSYNDGAQKIHTDGTNLLTAAIGAKYEKAFEQGDWKFTPSARVAATYDVVSDDTESAIRVIGGGQYHVISAHQKRAAYEAGLGLEASNGDWDFSVAYNGEFRSHFKSHTGMIKAKYNF